MFLQALSVPSQLVDYAKVCWQGHLQMTFEDIFITL